MFTVQSFREPFFISAKTYSSCGSSAYVRTEVWIHWRNVLSYYGQPALLRASFLVYGLIGWSDTKRARQAGRTVSVVCSLHPWLVPRNAGKAAPASQSSLASPAVTTPSLRHTCCLTASSTTSQLCCRHPCSYTLVKLKRARSRKDLSADCVCVLTRVQCLLASIRRFKLAEEGSCV